MPVIKSAIKKQRQDVRRTMRNDVVRARLRDTMRKVRKNQISLAEAYSVVDKSAKLHIIHVNKAARMKSQIASAVPATKKVASKTTKAPTRRTKKATATS